MSEKINEEIGCSDGRSKKSGICPDVMPCDNWALNTVRPMLLELGFESRGLWPTLSSFADAVGRGAQVMDSEMEWSFLKPVTGGKIIVRISRNWCALTAVGIPDGDGRIEYTISREDFSEQKFMTIYGRISKFLYANRNEKLP